MTEYHIFQPNKKIIQVGSQVQNHINLKKVVGYWDFDNVVGGKIIDKSGNDNHTL